MTRIPSYLFLPRVIAHKGQVTKYLNINEVTVSVFHKVYHGLLCNKGLNLSNTAHECTYKVCLLNTTLPAVVGHRSKSQINPG